MRRKDREVTDRGMIHEIIDRCMCCRIGFYDEGQVYIVPLSFGYEKNGDDDTFYFHGAQEGRKIDLIHKSPSVGFEMDTGYRIHEGELACSYSAAFQSIIGNGEMSMVTDPEEKKKGLKLIMDHTAGKKEWVFSDKMLSAVAVFKLTVTQLSCKEHL